MGKLDELIEALGPGATAPVPVPVKKEKEKKETEKPLTKKDKFAILTELNKTLNKQFDCKVSLVRMGEKVGVRVPSISTNLPSLDEGVIQSGGIPRGRIVEIYGPESSGKTTFTLHLIACEQQSTDNLCAFIDAEHSLDPTYASTIGVNMDELIVSQPDSGEQALETAEALVDSGSVSLIVIDSVAALVPQAELDGEMGDSVVYETPVYIRRKGTTNVEIKQVGDLYGGQRTGGTYRKTSRMEVLTHQGWKQLLAVQKKPNIAKKEIVYTRTAQGYIGTTKDHSLFVNGKEASPNELKVFDRLDTHNEPIDRGLCNVISEDVAWLLGFYVAEGSTPKSPVHNRFEVSNTEIEPLDKCKKIIREVFSLEPVIRKVSEPTDTRKALYALSCASDTILAFFMHSCVCPKSRDKQVPIFVLNGNKDVKDAFLDGFWHGDGNHANPDKPRKFFNNSWAVIAGIKFINEVPTSVAISPARTDQLTLTEGNTKMFAANEIRKFYEGGVPEFLYDIETEAGTFVTAIGNIICHNSNMGLQARLMSQAMRKLRGKANTKGVTLLFTNQIREKIGVMFGSPETTSGGRALKFFASLRLDIRRKDPIGAKDSPIGHVLKIRAVKNKMGCPMRETLVNLLYGKGLDTFADTVSYAATIGVIEQSGAWYSFQNERIAYGLENVIEKLRSEPKLYEKILLTIKQKGEIITS